MNNNFFKINYNKIYNQTNFEKKKLIKILYDKFILRSLIYQKYYKKTFHILDNNCYFNKFVKSGEFNFRTKYRKITSGIIQSIEKKLKRLGSLKKKKIKLKKIKIKFKKIKLKLKKIKKKKIKVKKIKKIKNFLTKRLKYFKKIEKFNLQKNLFLFNVGYNVQGKTFLFKSIFNKKFKFNMNSQIISSGILTNNLNNIFKSFLLKKSCNKKILPTPIIIFKPMKAGFIAFSYNGYHGFLPRKQIKKSIQKYKRQRTIFRKFSFLHNRYAVTWFLAKFKKKEIRQKKFKKKIMRFKKKKKKRKYINYKKKRYHLVFTFLLSK